MVDGGKFIAGEAVFYINSISEIKKIILENKFSSLWYIPDSELHARLL